MCGSVQYTTAVAHRSLLEFELMALTPPHVGLSLPLTDLLDRRRAGQGAHGGTPSHHLGRRIDQQKIYNIKFTAALNGHRLMVLNATANQKLAAVTEGSIEGRCDKREAWGKCNSIVLGALDVE